VAHCSCFLPKLSCQNQNGAWRLAAPLAVIPSGAGRRFFFPPRACQAVGLRREESLFALVAHSLLPSLQTLLPNPKWSLATRRRLAILSLRKACHASLFVSFRNLHSQHDRKRRSRNSRLPPGRLRTVSRLLHSRRFSRHRTHPRILASASRQHASFRRAECFWPNRRHHRLPSHRLRRRPPPRYGRASQLPRVRSRRPVVDPRRSQASPPALHLHRLGHHRPSRARHALLRKTRLPPSGKISDFFGMPLFEYHKLLPTNATHIPLSLSCITRLISPCLKAGAPRRRGFAEEEKAKSSNRE
jgi:hypothetical protein